MADIFISYARFDHERAKALAEALEKEDYSVWWDPKIPPGKTFDEVIAEALGNAKCVVVLWSKESVKSEWVKEEASVAKRRKILVPALIDDVELPLGFGLIQAADLTDWEKGNAHPDFDSMIEAIAAIVGPLPGKEPVQSELEPAEPQDTEPSPSEPEPIKSKPAETPSPKPEVTEPEPAEIISAEPIPSEPTPSEPSKKRFILSIGVLSGVALFLLLGVLWYTRQPPVPSTIEVTPTTREVQPPPAKIEVPTQNTITNGIGMKFVLISAGSFKMGSNDGTREEMPVHEVTLTKSFYMQTTEVTQGQWKRIMGYNNSFFKNCGDECPVEQVSWKDATAFISKLNDMEGTNKYRLPTEAEWEYACRAGSDEKYSFGSSASELENYAWYEFNADQTHPVAQKKPNKWGLYDMLGNVAEWCEDYAALYPTGHVIDDKGPTSGNSHMVRGSSWVMYSKYVHCAYRFWQAPGHSHFSMGFRVARDL